MASTSATPLTEQLREAGVSLLHSPSSVEELLALLDKAEDLLFGVDQAPPPSVKDALLPMMKALKSDPLLKHSEATVRVSVASCIHEITRITAPLEPYDDELMKEIFKLTVSSFEKLSQPYTRCYEKAASILYTIARVRSCVVMLDLDCDGLVVEMFRHFLKTTESNHTEDVLWAMETIMTLVLEESEEISVELLELLLASVRKENEIMAPISWKLGESVISNCVAKLRPILKVAVESAGIALDQYAPVVASICGSSSDNSEHLLANGSQNQRGPEALVVTSAEVGTGSGLDGHLSQVPENECLSAGEDSSSKLKSFNPADANGSKDLGAQSESLRKRDRRPNSLMNPEEGYEHYWGLLGSKSHHIKPQESPKPKDSPKGKKRKFLRKKHNTVGTAVALLESETASDGEGQLLVSCKQTQPGQLNREGPSSSVEIGVKRKKCVLAYDKEKAEVSGKKVGHDGRRYNLPPFFADTYKLCHVYFPRIHFFLSSSCYVKDVGLSSSASSIKDGVSSERTDGAGPKRKWTRRNEEQDIGEEVVGRKIKVWWPKDKMFYDGVVRCYDPKRKRHQVLYTDGVEERLNLKKQRWKLIEDEDTANPKQNEQPELLRNRKRKKRSKSTKDSNPYRLVKRAGASSTLPNIEPSDGSNKDEPVSLDSNVGNAPQIDKPEVEDAKTSETEENPYLSCSEGPEV